MTPRFLIISLALLATAPLALAQDAGIPATLYQTVNARSGPDTRFEIVGQVTQGDIVTVTGRDDDESTWLQVVLPGGAVGWIPSYLLVFESDPGTLPVIAAPGEGEAGADVTIQAFGTINVRSGPSIVSDIIAQLESGYRAQALARSNEANNWLYIENSLVAGWVAFFTVYVEGDPDTLPLRVPDAAGSDLVHPGALIATRFNTRLHTEPTLESPVVDILPFNTEVTPLAKTEDGEWLYVGSGDLTGWATMDLFSISAEYAAALPVYDASADSALTPETTDIALTLEPSSSVVTSGTPEATATE